MKLIFLNNQRKITFMKFRVIQSNNRGLISKVGDQTFYSRKPKIGEENTLGLAEINTTTKGPPVLVSYSAIPLHSHNNTLQIWLELGLIGIIIFNLFVFCLLKNIFNLTNKNLIKIPFLVGGFICIFLINQSSFGLWQTWWLAIITFFSFIFRLISEKKD